LKIEVFMGRRILLLVAVMAAAVVVAVCTFGGEARAADPPQITSVSVPPTQGAAEVNQSQTREFVVSGSGFQEGAAFSLEKSGTVATASSVRVVSPNELRATVFVNVPTSERIRSNYDAVVTNPDGQRAVLADAVNVFPMLSPARSWTASRETRRRAR
jgi:hypothetical protein